MKPNVILTLIIVILTLAGCKNAHNNDDGVSEIRYTCPMHPTVISNEPGTCPVCNMSLVKVEPNTDNHSGMNGSFVTLDKRRQQLAGIEMDTVKLRHVMSSSTFLGTVAIDERTARNISSRVKGRIDKLFVKADGVYVKRGTALYSIYSEQLQADQKEYLTLLKKNKQGDPPTLISDLLRASKNRLMLWGLTAGQVSDLERSGIASALMTFYSQESGYVRDVNITEGMYVDEGTAVFNIISLDEVWIEAQLYPNEIENVGGHKTFDIFLEGNNEKIYSGTLAYSNPQIEEGRKIYLLRIKVENSNGDLIPGMPVYVSPKESTSKALAIPRSAVLLERMKTVWVLAHENTFEKRMIDTGREGNFWIEVTSGLKEGEVIVSEGGYLISSEFILKSGSTQAHVH